MTFSAPCVQNSPIPGLPGLDSLETHDALIRCRTGEMWFLGPGGIAELKTSPGTRPFQMAKSKSGHWLLPVSRFGGTTKKTTVVLPTTMSTSASSTDRREDAADPSSS